jgi:tetratricopeptide (TPR) repeat protein
MTRLWFLSAAMFTLMAQAPETIMKQALEAHQKGDIDSAIRYYREFLKARPSSIEAHSNLGAALSRKGEYEAAIDQYEAAMKLSPGNPGVWLNLALAYYKLGDYQRAGKELNALRAATGGNPQTTLLLADCWLQTGENQRVIKLLEPINQENKADLAVDYLLGTALLREKKFTAGQALLDRILKNGDSAEARLMMGTAKLGINDYAGALQDLARAVELNPNLPSVNSYYGQALVATGDTPGAVKAFRAELALNPNDFGSNLNLGILMRQEQDIEAARTLLARALRVRPGDLGARYQIAAMDLGAGMAEQAERELSAIIAEAPKFTEAHVLLATAFYRLKRKEDGDRERALVQKLNAETQAAQPKGDPIAPEKK